MHRIVLVLTLMAFSGVGHAAEIRATDIGDKITVVGRLGHELGTIVEIRCRGIAKPKGPRRKMPDYKHKVEVLAVNGKALKAPLRITFSQNGIVDVKKPAANEEATWIGYEHGLYEGMPGGAFEHVPAIQSMNYHFTTSFVALKKK